MAGGLPTETVTTSYDNTGRALTLTSPAASYIASTTYQPWGASYQQINGTGTKRIRQTRNIDEATSRLTSAVAETENQATPNTWVEKLTRQYGYDASGNVKNIADTNAGAIVSNQCFDYDALRELTEAWTTTCTAPKPSHRVWAGVSWLSSRMRA